MVLYMSLGGEDTGDPLQYSCLENPMESLVGCSPWGREESDTTERLHFHFSLSCIGEGNGNPLQCSCWRILGTGEPGGLPSMGSHRVGHDWSDAAAATIDLEFLYHLALMLLPLCDTLLLTHQSNTQAVVQLPFYFLATSSFFRKHYLMW